MDSWGCFHTHTCPSTRYNWKQDSSHQATCFLSSTDRCLCWQAQVRRKVVYCEVSKGTKVGLPLQKPISMMYRWMVCMLTLVDCPALKSAAICRRVPILWCWIHFCKIFFWPQWFWRFDVLLNSWYSWCTYEMVIQENPQFFINSEMLYPHLSCTDYNIMFKFT